MQNINSAFGAVKDIWLINWGYILCTQEAEEAWVDKLKLDDRLSKVKNPDKPHGRMYELPSYQSPIDGRWIDGRVARREDLARSNCIEYDDSMPAEQAKRFAQEDAALDKKVDAIVEETIYAMPAAKREQLATEIENSDVEIINI